MRATRRHTRDITPLPSTTMVIAARLLLRYMLLPDADGRHDYDIATPPPSRRLRHTLL